MEFDAELERRKHVNNLFLGMALLGTISIFFDHFAIISVLTFILAISILAIGHHLAFSRLAPILQMVASLLMILLSIIQPTNDYLGNLNELLHNVMLLTPIYLLKVVAAIFAFREFNRFRKTL